MVAPANKCADRGRRGIKNVDPIFFDDFPKPVWFRPIRRTFVHHRCRAVSERTIDDVAVAGDPANISGTPKNILISNVEDVFRGRVNANQITARSVEDAFWFPCGAAGIEKVKGMLAVEGHRRTVRIDIFQLAKPPDVAAFFHVNVISGAAKNDDAPDWRTMSQCL